ncbi:hypothetical protein BUZ12_13990, partial [Staphylococcus gallinarum]
MKVNIFKQKVKKQLWFLNKKEKRILDEVLQAKIDSDESGELNRPIAFSNQILKSYIFKEKVTSTTQLFVMLIG